MNRIRFSVVCSLALMLLAAAAPSCKTAKPTETFTKADTITQPKTNIHTSDKVQGGTIINGPAPDNSPNGSKPKQ